MLVSINSVMISNIVDEILLCIQQDIKMRRWGCKGNERERVGDVKELSE